MQEFKSGPSHHREGRMMLVECARLLGDEITWAEKMDVLQSMRAIRFQMRSFDIEDQHLQGSQFEGATIGAGMTHYTTAARGHTP